MKKTTAPISLAGSQLGEVRHVCAFFNSDDEEYRVLLPFIRDGFECGDKAVHVVNPGQRHDHLQRLATVGIDPAAAEQSGQLEVRINTEAYIRDGHFDQDRMLAAFEQMASGNAKGGFPLSRICCRMDWAIENRSYIDDLVEFESRVNDVHLPAWQVWRRHGDRHHADASDDHHRRPPAPESLLRAARRIPARDPPTSGHAAFLIFHGCLIWKSHPNLLPAKSSTFNGALTILLA